MISGLHTGLQEMVDPIITQYLHVTVTRMWMILTRKRKLAKAIVHHACTPGV